MKIILILLQTYIDSSYCSYVLSMPFLVNYFFASQKLTLIFVEIFGCLLFKVSGYHIKGCNMFTKLLMFILNGFILSQQ